MGAWAEAGTGAGARVLTGGAGGRVEPEVDGPAVLVVLVVTTGVGAAVAVGECSVAGIEVDALSDGLGVAAASWCTPRAPMVTTSTAHPATAAVEAAALSARPYPMGPVCQVLLV